jgi:DNA-binding MarR family transcriptional regulator
MRVEDQSFAHWIGRIRRGLRREFEARTAALDITAPQFLLLSELWEQDGMAASDLAREVYLTAGAVTGLLDRLEAKELLRRERDPNDRRALRVWLTPAGRALRAPLMGIIREVNEKALEGLSEAERQQLARMLEHVARNVGS